jgi:hypothetical protein
MAEISDAQISKFRAWYSRLDRYLLILLSLELSYFILLILAGIVVTILVSTMDFAPDFFDNEIRLLWPVLIYIFALPLNMLGGLASIYLNIRKRREGYPGTGHLLNWIFLMTTGWLFILALVFMLPTFMRLD